MQRLVFAIALIVAGFFHHVAHADTDAPIECFSSPEAVHDAHPASHAAGRLPWPTGKVSWYPGCRKGPCRGGAK